MTVDYSKGFIKQLRALPQKEKVAASINELVATFGKPHLHKGIGVRDLGRGLYEFRTGLQLRGVFQVRGDCLYFWMIGSHKEVQAWKKNNT